MADNSLHYADATTDAERPRPTKHSRLAMIAILIYAAVAVGKVAVWVYGYYRWHPEYRDYRLYYRVVEPYGLLTIAGWAYALGTAFALTAILQRCRKRSLAVFAFLLNFAAVLYLLNENVWGFALSRARE
jgi:hypothetical protein